MLHDIGMWAGGMALTVLLIPMAKKAINAFVNKDFKNVLDKSMTLENVTDPVLRKKLETLSFAAVDVVEYITPNRGDGQLGDLKFKKVDDTLAAIPILAAAPAVRKALISLGCEALWAADDTMKTELSQHKQP